MVRLDGREIEGSSGSGYKLGLVGVSLGVKRGVRIEREEM